MDAQKQNELCKAMGTIEATLKAMCKKSDERQENNSKEHTEIKDLVKDIRNDNKTKTSGAVFKAVVFVLFTLVCGAFAYTYMIDDKTNAHAQDYEIHYMDHKGEGK